MGGEEVRLTREPRGGYLAGMPQVQLPLFPAGSTQLNESLAVECREGQVICFNGHLPVFTHAQEDLAAFRLFTSQRVVNGSASQGDIRRAFSPMRPTSPPKPNGPPMRSGTA